jgi:cytochrome c5
MSNWKPVFAFAIVAAAIAASLAVHAQQPSADASKPGAKTNSSQVRSIMLPHFEPVIAQGPNVEIYSKYCLACHSGRYVSIQPRFPKSVWQSEVKKMIDAYGAVIPDADQPLIVEYLVAVRGTEAPASAHAPSK